jgi:hypothetical protein
VSLDDRASGEAAQARSTLSRASADTLSRAAFTRACRRGRVIAKEDAEVASAAGEMRGVALATSVFVGMQPVLTQVPPNRLRSIMATVMPRPTAWRRGTGPPGQRRR